MTSFQVPPRLRRPLHALAWAVLTACVFAVDLRNGTEPSLTLFYLFPVVHAAWFGGTAAGLGAALVSVACWAYALGVPTAWPSPRGWVVAWNAGAECGVFGLLAWTVASLRRAFERERALRGALESAWRDLDREQREVGRMQRGLLPAALPAPPGWSLAAHYATSRRAGGDYYDVVPAGPDALLVVIADAAGHGTPAAVLMAVLRALFHADGRAPDDPAEALASVDRRLEGNVPEALFATACAVRVGLRGGTLRWSRAGHCPPLLRRADGRVEPLEGGDGLPLGIRPASVRSAAERRIAPGETLLLYTDGVVEAMDAARDLFGEERLRDLLARHAPEGPAALCARVATALAAHRGTAPLADDVTLLAIRRED